MLGPFSAGASVVNDASVEGPGAGEMFVDAVAVRPMTLAASAVGFVVRILTLSVMMPGGSAADAGKPWVVDPLERTLVRPLGGHQRTIGSAFGRAIAWRSGFCGVSVFEERQVFCKAGYYKT